jgi:hypothetical protein
VYHPTYGITRLVGFGPQDHRSSSSHLNLELSCPKEPLGDVFLASLLVGNDYLSFPICNSKLALKLRFLFTSIS